MGGVYESGSSYVVYIVLVVYSTHMVEDSVVPPVLNNHVYDI